MLGHTEDILYLDSASPSLEKYRNTFNIAAKTIAEPGHAEVLQLTSEAPSLERFLGDFNVPGKKATIQRKPKPVKTGVPPGFEALMLEQTTLVDVYFTKRFVVSTLATFTPVSIRLDSPEDVVELIPTLLDQAAVFSALKDELNSNSELQCYSKQQTNCGLLEPDIAEVIFNSETYRVDLFINPALLSVQQNVVSKYLGPSSADVSFFQTLNFALSSSDAKTLQSFNGRTTLSLKETSLEILSDHSSDASYNITSMNLQRDWEGRRFQGGYITTNSSSLRFSQNANILGVRVGTTLDTREDLRQTTGNAIEIFLPQRSRVALFKDGRLVASRIYEPGNQQLDTSSLPGGAYDVEIVINDGAGERTETRFYSKSPRIPPADQPQFFLEGGRTTKRTTDTLPDALKDYLWRAGYNRRINKSSSFTLGVSGKNDNTMFEGGWFGVFPALESSIDFALTEDKRQGINISLRLPIFSTHVFVDHRQVWNNDRVPVTAGALLGPALKQSSFTTAIPLGPRTLGLGARYNTRGTLGSEKTYSATYHLKDLRFGKSTLRSNLQWVRQNGDDTVLFNVGYFSTGERLTFNADAEYNYRNDADGRDTSSRGATALSYRNDPNSPTAVYAQLNTRHQNNADTLGLEIDTRGRYGRLRTQAERNFAQNSSGIVYTANYATSLVATADSFAFGGQELNRSAIIVDLSKSEAEKNHFDVIVNNTPVTTAIPGRRTVVPVTPYSHYEVSLRARGSGFISFTDRTHNVTLYPGNAVNLSWQADTVVIIFSELTDQHGKPVQNALIHGVAGLATTNEFGQFQAEISPSTTDLKFETISHECMVKLPDYEAENGIGFLPPLTCPLIKKADK